MEDWKTGLWKAIHQIERHIGDMRIVAARIKLAGGTADHAMDKLRMLEGLRSELVGKLPPEARSNGKTEAV